MAKNEGKLFEEDFKKSIPFDYGFYRFKDGTGNFGGTKNENVRFQAHNISDCEVMGKKYLFILELKSHKGSSIPFSCIRPTQLKEMSDIKHEKVKAYFIFNYRDLESTFAIDVQTVKKYIEEADRKSIPIKWVIENGIELKGTKKKVRFRYDLESFFKKVEEYGQE